MVGLLSNIVTGGAPIEPALPEAEVAILTRRSLLARTPGCAQTTRASNSLHAGGGTVKSRIILTALCLVLGPAELAQAAGEQPANPAPAAPADAAPAVPAAAAPAAPAAAAPAAAAPAGPPSPAAEMAQLKLFSGNTHCSGKQSASQFGPEHPTQSVVHGRPDLNGFWMTLRYNERKTKEDPYPFHALYQIGYDSAAKQYVLVEVDNFGGHATATSS